jgi:hypothetical protein
LRNEKGGGGMKEGNGRSGRWALLIWQIVIAVVVAAVVIGAVWYGAHLFNVWLQRAMQP